MTTGTRSHALAPLFGTILAFSLGACGSSGTGAPDRSSPSSEVILVEGVTSLDSTAADDVVVLPDRLLFPVEAHPEIAKRAAGDILVGDRGTSSTSANRTGFLRRILSVEKKDGTYEVMTEMAALTDIVRQGEFQFFAETSDADVWPVASTRSFGPGLKPQGKAIELLTFSGTTLLDKTQSVTLPGTQKTIGYTVWAKVATGTVLFTPKFDVGAKIKPDLENLLGSLHEAHVIGTGRLDGELQVDVGLALQSSVTGDDLAQLIANRITGSADNVLVQYDFSLGSGKLGPLSIPVNGRFTASVHCEFAWGGEVSVIGGGKASAQVTVGYRYQKDSGFEPVWSHTESLEQIGPEWTVNGDVALKCTLRPEFHINLFDIAAGDVWADAYAAMRAQAICNQGNLTGDVKGEAFAGVSATAHAKVDAFGLWKWEKTCSLFDVESPRATVTASWPLGAGATCSGSSATEFASTAHDEPEASCFGGGSKPPEPGTDAGLPTDAGGSDTGAVDAGDGGGDTTDGCPGTTEPVSYAWSCEPERWGDCICDCECGASDVDCQVGECGGCDHDVCTEGGPLGIHCDKDGQGGECIRAICENDSYCCEHSWTLSCVAHVEKGDFGCAVQVCE